MTKYESSIWYLFKDCFNLDWVSKQGPGTLIGIYDFLSPLLKVIEERLKQFD